MLISLLIPMVHPLAGDEAPYYIECKLWFGFLGLCIMIVYVKGFPWSYLSNDFEVP